LYGVASVELSNRMFEGRHCETFDYSTKKSITITAEEKMIKEEEKRVRSLKTGGKREEKRDLLPGQLWEDDCIKP
jgi:hypothetical protein